MFDLQLTPEQACLREARSVTELLPGLGDPMAWVVGAEALGVGDSGIAYAVLSSLQVALLIARCGDREQQAAYLPRFEEEPLPTGSVLLYEDFGRLPAEFSTVAVSSGASWVIDGRKTAVVNPGTADVSVLVARNAAFVYEGTPAGVVIERDDRDTGKLALGPAHTGTVSVHGLELPDRARLAVDQRTLCLCRLTLAGIAVGAATSSLAYASDWARRRVAFGKPIAAYQGVSFPLVDLAMEIDAARLLLWEAASGVDTVADANELERLTSRAVSKATSTCVRAGSEAVQTLGVHGIIADHPVERWYRAAATLAAIDFDPCFGGSVL